MKGERMRTAVYCCVAAAFFFFSQCPSQTKPDTSAAPKEPWKIRLVTGLNVTQVSFSNWAQGGENSLAYSVSGIGKTEFEDTDIHWSFSYNLGFGQTKLGDQGLRNTDDKIDLETVLTYKLGAYVNPYAGATMKTQFATGYKYDDLGNGTPVSKFFDPAYFTESIGAGYIILPQVKTRLGYGLREIYTNDFYIYTDDPNTPAHERVKIDDGFDSSTDIQWNIEDNVILISKLEVFLTVRTLNKASLRSDNTLRVQVAKYVSVSLSANIINDRQVSPYTQFMNTLAMGLNYNLF